MREWVNSQETEFEALAVVIIVASVAFRFRVFAVREHWPQMVPLVAPGAGPG
jgi:hypothetical protein